MADKYEDLRTYVAVIDNGGINAAAAFLGIAKSAVSRRLGELEERLGVELITRTTRSFEPTAAGRRYYQGARAVLESIDALDADVAPDPMAKQRKVRIAVDRSLLAMVAGSLAKALTADGTTAEILDAAGADLADVDIWIGMTPASTNELERRSAGVIGMATVGAPAWLDDVGRPTSFAELRALAGVAVESLGADGWAFGDEGPQHPTIILTVPDVTSAVAAAAAGTGLARVPSPLVVEAISRGSLEQVLGTREPTGSPVEMWVRKDGDAPTRHVADRLATMIPRSRS